MIHIKMNDEYNTITTYYGDLDNKYPFMVEISYNSNVNHYEISSIEFIGNESKEPKRYWNKAEDKIKDFAMKWLFEKKRENNE